MYAYRLCIIYCFCVLFLSLIIEKFKHYLNNFNFPNRLRSSNGVNSKFLYFFHVILGEVYAPAEIFSS